MINYKVSNLFDLQGTAQYKGLKLDQIVAGSQVYPHDENLAYLKYAGKQVDHKDLSILTEEEYENLKGESLSKAPKSPIDELIAKNEELQNKQTLMQTAIDDLIFGGSF